MMLHVCSCGFETKEAREAFLHRPAEEVSGTGGHNLRTYQFDGIAQQERETMREAKVQPITMRRR